VTLVVARISGRALTLAADWRITEKGMNPHFKSGRLKILPLRPELLVAYSGSVAEVTMTLREFNAQIPNLRETQEQLDSLLDHLEESQRISTHGPADYLVAARIDGIPHLWVVRNGARERSRRSAWIGDIEAFERFQELAELYRFDDSADGLEPRLKDSVLASNVASVLGKLVFERSASSIGELCISCSLGREGFIIRPSGSIALTQNKRIDASAEARLQNAAARSIDGGVFHCEVVPPEHPGIPAVGVYLREGRIGLWSHPLVRDETKIIPSVSCSEFVEKVRAIEGIALRGPSLPGAVSG
jgi:hypothetical protein